MSPWMKGIRWGKVAASGGIVTVIMMVAHQVEAIVMMPYYTDPAYFGVWSPLMMPSSSVGGPPPLAFFFLSAVFTFLTAATLAAVFDFVKESFGKSYWTRVIGFTDIMVGLSIVFGYFPMYLMFRVPAMLLVSWLVSTFVSTLLGAMVYAKKLK